MHAFWVEIDFIFVFLSTGRARVEHEWYAVHAGIRRKVKVSFVLVHWVLMADVYRCLPILHGNVGSGGATPGRARSNDLAGRSTALPIALLR